ncbi:hypothetical protein FJTKL_08088 [Diaporthe vaccinii]|uniref:Uncharacterized protein n=1 Tax=Diaporthe vaccinii TaxID=105482 RepID=A0ABR4DPG2_9PEZI
MPRKQYALDSRFPPSFPPKPTDFQPIYQVQGLFHLQAALKQHSSDLAGQISEEDRDLLQLAAVFAGWQTLYERYDTVHNPSRDSRQQLATALNWTRSKENASTPASWRRNGELIDKFKSSLRSWKAKNRLLAETYGCHRRYHQLVASDDSFAQNATLDELQPSWSPSRYQEFRREINAAPTAADRETIVKRYFNLQGNIKFGPPAYSSQDPQATMSGTPQQGESSKAHEEMGTVSDPQSSRESTVEPETLYSTYPAPDPSDPAASIDTQVPRQGIPKQGHFSSNSPQRSVEDFLQSEHITDHLGSLPPDQQAITRILLSRAFRAGQAYSPAAGHDIHQKGTPHHPSPGLSMRGGRGRGAPRSYREPPHMTSAAHTKDRDHTGRQSQYGTGDDHVYDLDQDDRSQGSVTRSQGPSAPSEPPDDDGGLTELSAFQQDRDWKDTTIGRFEPYENWNDYAELIHVSRVVNTIRAFNKEHLSTALPIGFILIALLRMNSDFSQITKVSNDVGILDKPATTKAWQTKYRFNITHDYANTLYHRIAGLVNYITEHGIVKCHALK